jgi:hypothetical protein
MHPTPSNIRSLPGMLLVIAGMAILGFVWPLSARVTQMVVTKVESPTLGGAAFGSVGQYEPAFHVPLAEKVAVNREGSWRCD